MKLVVDTKNKKIFVDGNKRYQMIDMGSYVRNVAWYESAPEVWTLMAFDEREEDGSVFHLEALVDNRGNYIRFILEKGNQKRVILIENGQVYSDTLTDNGVTYLGVEEDIYTGNKYPLDEYLNSKVDYMSEGKIFSGKLTSNDTLKHFLSVNNELQNSLKKVIR